ncbi:MAG TPA: hypothetical protein VJN69_00365 [Candidatus Acidoferrales bacterium]|nr:hypothetical protein [Candidatus Acidoferrales bacterium]
MSLNLNRRINAEVDVLVAQNVLSARDAKKIAERYPTTPWDLLVLVRWFTILGAVVAGAGVVILANEYVKAIHLAEAGLSLATVGLIWLGRYLARAKGLMKTGAALEMTGGFALQGLIFVLAIDFSHGSKNWPALIGIQSLTLAMLAYALKNRLMLIHAAICFFVFFGGETGYESGWGAYWLEMTYPLRFLAVGFVFVAIAWLHAAAFEREYQNFSRVYAHLGVIDINFALWFLSVFGYFEETVRWSASDGERAAFSGLWALVSLLSLWLAGVIGQGILKSYGMTFLIINIYTFYFQFVVDKSAALWWLHLLIVGGSLVGLGFVFERRLRHPASPQESPALE